MPKRTTSEFTLENIVKEHAKRLVGALTQALRLQAAAPQPRVREVAAKPGRAAEQRRILPCIAPGCTNPSKGPRFHYLCERHKGASKRDYEAWRAGSPKDGKKDGKKDGMKAAQPRAARVAKTPARRSSSRILPCIAPGCSKPSKGPRFHYLCEEHRHASRRDYEAWRKQKMPGHRAA